MNIDADKYKRWLIESKEFQSRSAKDALSRLRRVDRMCSVTEKEDGEKFLNRLSALREFKILKISVKSQLRRSCKLYFEYMDW